MAEEINYRSPTYYELSAPPHLDWRRYRGENWRQYRKQWDQRALEHHPGDFPLHLDIDPTNRCNLRCVMCPRTVYIKKGQKSWNPKEVLGSMDFSFYAALIEQGIKNGLQSVKLNFLGEPLMAPRIVEMVALAAKAGLWVMINTNATLLDSDMSHRLLEAGLTDIFFSFDSPYKQEYEQVRQGAVYEDTLKNIENFILIKDKLNKKYVQTRASMVLPQRSTDQEIEILKHDYIKIFRSLGVAEIGFGLPSVVGLDYEKEYGLFPGFICPDIFRRMFVFWDGPVSPCCGDWERRLIMGDATREPLVDIWKNKTYEQLRRAHLDNEYEKIKACRICSVPYLSTQEV